MSDRQNLAKLADELLAAVGTVELRAMPSADAVENSSDAARLADALRRLRDAAWAIRSEIGDTATLPPQDPADAADRLGRRTGV